MHREEDEEEERWEKRGEAIIKRGEILMKILRLLEELRDAEEFADGNPDEAVEWIREHLSGERYVEFQRTSAFATGQFAAADQVLD